MRSLLSAVDRHGLRFVLVFAACELVAGGVVAAHFGTRIRFYDEGQYVAIGHHLAHDGSYSIYGQFPTAYRTPGWPLIIAGLDALGLGLPAVRFLNFVIVAGTLLAVYALTRSFASQRAGVLAALLTALFPVLDFTATTLYPQTLSSLLTVLTVLSAVRTRQSRGRSRLGLAFATGLCGGALTMVVPTFVFVPPVIVLWLLISQRRSAVPACLILTLGALALPGAWTIRNAVVFRHFIPLTTSSGFNLLVGNHPGATAAGDYNAAAINPYKAEARRLHLDEYDADNLMQKAAIHWIEHHPGHAIALYFGKLLNNFAWINNLETPGQNSVLRSVVAAISFLPLLLLLLLRLVLIRRRPLQAGESLMLTIYAGNALLLAIYITRVRYRLPVDMLLISVVSAFLVDMLPATARKPALLRSPPWS